MWDSQIEIEWDAPDLLRVLEDEASKEFAMAELSTRKSESVFSSGNERSKQHYYKRLEAIGFMNKNCILDAGCGIGQWSYVMSEHNGFIYAIDQSLKRLEIAQYLNRKHSNMSFTQGNLEDMSLNMSFDAIFCYGVFMFTDMRQTLLSFKRHLAHDGVMFINFNNVGHYMHRIYHLPNQDYQKMVENYYKGHYKCSLMTLSVMTSLLHELDLEIIYCGYDGESANLPFYKTHYCGFPYITELLIKHKGYL